MTEKNYVVNVKTRAGTIVTARGDTADELVNNINGLIAVGADEAIATLEQLLTGVTQKPSVNEAIDTVLASLGGSVINEEPNNTAFAPVPPPNMGSTASQVGARMCQHGSMVGRKGNGAKGEWKGLFCPTPKGTVGQCEPVWLNRSMPEWNSV